MADSLSTRKTGTRGHGTAFGSSGFTKCTRSSSRFCWESIGTADCTAFACYFFACYITPCIDSRTFVHIAWSFASPTLWIGAACVPKHVDMRFFYAIVHSVDSTARVGGILTGCL